jgi:hypothetical protein
MHAERAGPRLASVADRGPQTLTLEIEASAGSIAGRMSDAQGTSVEFGGWVGLAGALERFLAGDQPVEPADREPA